MAIKLADIPNWIKTGTAIIGFVAAVVGAVIAAEDRYVTQQEAAQTLEQFRGQQTQQFNVIRYDFMEERYYKMKQYVREHPTDAEAQAELKALEMKREDLRKELGL